MAGGYRVVLARGAHAQLRRVPARPRGGLTLTLQSIAAGEPEAGLLAVWKWGHVAACEILAARRLVLVCAILDRRALQAELLGPELDGEFRDRSAARFMHGRR